MRKTVDIPKYTFAIFDDETEDQRKAREEQERKTREDQERQQREQQDRERQQREETERKQREEQERQDRERREREDQERKEREQREKDEKDRQDRQQRSGESNAAYEQRIKDLNDENKTRRQENRDLKSNISTLERRLIRGDVEKAISAANPVDDAAANRAADLFMSDMQDHLQVDQKSGKTVGLDKFEDWKKSNGWFFKAEGSGGGQGDGKRGNATANGASRGGGSGSGNDTHGIPDLTSLSPKDRTDAIRKYKQSLQGAGSGYGRASSKK